MKNTRSFKWMRHCLVPLVLIVLASSANAGIVVVVNANSHVGPLSRDEVVNIFMGRYRRLPDGSQVQPVDIRGEALERRDFYNGLLGKTLAEINAYWARLIFTGQTPPPMAVNNSRDVMEKILRNPSFIGYMQSQDVSDQVKVVYSLPQELHK